MKWKSEIVKTYFLIVVLMLVFHKWQAQSVELVTPENPISTMSTVELLHGKILARQEFNSSEVEFLLSDDLKVLYRRNFNCGGIFHLIHSPVNERHVIIIGQKKVVLWDCVGKTIMGEVSNLNLMDRWNGNGDVQYCLFRSEQIQESAKLYLAIACFNGSFLVVDVDSMQLIFTDKYKMGLFKPFWSNQRSAITVMAMDGKYMSWSFKDNKMESRSAESLYKGYHLINGPDLVASDSANYQFMQNNKDDNEFVLFDRNFEKPLQNSTIHYDIKSNSFKEHQFYSIPQWPVISYRTNDSLLFFSSKDDFPTAEVSSNIYLKGVNLVNESNDTLLIVHGQKVLPNQNGWSFENTYYIVVKKLRDNYWDEVTTDSVAGNYSYSMSYLNESNRFFFSSIERCFYWTLNNGFEKIGSFEKSNGIKSCFIPESNDIHIITFFKSKNSIGVNNHYAIFNGSSLINVDLESENVFNVFRSFDGTTAVMRTDNDSLILFNPNKANQDEAKKFGCFDYPFSIVKNDPTRVRARYDTRRDVFEVNRFNEEKTSKLGGRFFIKSPMKSYFDNKQIKSPHFFLQYNKSADLIYLHRMFYLAPFLNKVLPIFVYKKISRAWGKRLMKKKFSAVRELYAYNGKKYQRVKGLKTHQDLLWGFTATGNSLCSDCFYYVDELSRLCLIQGDREIHKVYPWMNDYVESLKMSSNGKSFLIKNSFGAWSIADSSGIQIRDLPFSNSGEVFFSDNESRLISNKGNRIDVYSIAQKKMDYHLLILDSLNWLAYDDDYHYDGTPAAREQLYFTCGLEIIELSQLKDALYVPGLVEKIMSGQPILYPKLSELEICGTLPLIEKKEDGPYHYTITPRKLGLKRVEVYVNGKRVMMKSPEELNKKEEYYEWNIDEKEIKKFFVPGEENQVKVIGIVQQGNNEMQSRGVVEEVESTQEEKQHPTFYGLMVGVSDYKDDRLDLKYPTKDSKDLGQVMESAAKKLLNTSTENHVKMYYVNSEVKGENGYATPEREGVKKALQAISKEARAEDVVMIFFAGHGVMEGDKDKRFTFLTAESTKENLVGISTKDLEEWMSGEKGYLPNKTILIFDACNSGQATEELMAMARDDDETQRIRQVEDLKDKSGMFIMSASAANQSAYELPRYGHGLLTYSLLKTLKTSSSTLDEEKFINVQKWFLETETTMDNMTRELGIEQEAQPFGRGNIRVGELDEEIRSGIEIQQEKPMVYCANALNLSTTEDDLHFKELMNQGASRSITDQWHYAWGSANTYDVEVNMIYQQIGNAYEVKVKWKKAGKTLDTITIQESDVEVVKQKVLLETERVLQTQK